MQNMSNRCASDMLQMSKDRNREYLPRSAKKVSVTTPTTNRSKRNRRTSDETPIYDSPSSPSPPVGRPPQIDVQTNIQIFRLHRIDSSTEEFTIDCGITFIWNDPNLAIEAKGKYYSTHPAVVRYNPKTGRPDYERWPENLIVGENVFDPAWKILNSSNVDIIKSFTTILDSPRGTVHNFMHVQATVHQTLDLHSFPFDHQKVVVRLQSEHSDQVMRFVPFADGRKPVIYDKNKSSEWKLDPMGFEPMHLDFNVNKQAASSGVSYACMLCVFHAVRRPEWYLWNVILISFFIVFSSFSLFCLPSDSTAERLSILFTTWLMLISLKFIISDRLPKISYLTLLDIYLHSSYIVMMVLIVYVCASAYSPVAASIAASVEKGSGHADAVGTVLSSVQLTALGVTIHEPYLFAVFSTIWVIIHLYMVGMYYSRSWYR